MREFIRLYLKGIAMGAADLVPGVSGGTIALITGIYDELLRSISAIHPRLAIGFVKWEWKSSCLMVKSAGWVINVSRTLQAIH